MAQKKTESTKAGGMESFERGGSVRGRCILHDSLLEVRQDSGQSPASLAALSILTTCQFELQSFGICFHKHAVLILFVSWRK